MSHRHRILVVDDNDLLRENLVELLESEGYQILEARDGHEALEQLGQAPLPDLLLVDMMMPGMGGPELVSPIRAPPGLAGLRIVLATGMVPVRGAAQVDAVLSKPFGVEDLLAKIKPLLVARGVAAGQPRVEEA